MQQEVTMSRAWMTAVLLGANLAAVAVWGLERVSAPPPPVEQRVTRPPECPSSNPEPKVYSVEMEPEVFVAYASEPLTQADAYMVSPGEE
jgi:hypothetical protein